MEMNKLATWQSDIYIGLKKFQLDTLSKGRP